MKGKVFKMGVKDRVNQFIEEYNQKLQELNTRLQDASERAEYLTLEIRFLNEKELPEAQSMAVLEGTDDSHVTKLKKQFQKYADELQDKQEAQIILQNAIKQYQYQAGEKLVDLERLYKQEKSIQVSKHYSKMGYFKKQFVDSLIEEGMAIQELNGLDTQIQEILYVSGRKNGVYTDSSVKSTATNTGDGRTYLALSHQEVSRFVSGNHTSTDYEYLKKHSSLKDLR
jgi:hypothetical protein